MRSLLILFALLLTQAAYAQEVLGQERWPDGTLRATRYSEGDRIHFITYHENGKVKELGYFRNGRRDGVWKQYSEHGVMLAQASFRNGERQGIWEFRNEADIPNGRLTYTGGRLAQAEQFDAAGMITAQRVY